MEHVRRLQDRRSSGVSPRVPLSMSAIKVPYQNAGRV